MARNQSISDDKFRYELLQAVANGEDKCHNKTNFYQLLTTKFAIDKQRSLRLWDEYYPAIIDEVISQTNEIAKDRYAKFLEKRIKIKEERVLNLERELDRIIGELNGDIEFTYMLGNKIIASHQNGDFTAPVQIRNRLRQEMIRVQGEISKMQGDYAAEKIDIDGDFGTVVVLTANGRNE